MQGPVWVSGGMCGKMCSNQGALGSPVRKRNVWDKTLQVNKNVWTERREDCSKVWGDWNPDK